MKLQNDRSAHGMIQWLLDNTKNLTSFVLDVGCSNCGYLSNSYGLIHDLGWSGVLIDPMPIQIEETRELFKNISDVTCVHAAVCDQDGLVDVYIHVNDGDGTTTANFGSSLINNSNSRLKIKCPAIAYKTLVNQYNLNNIGILSIDTEGFDYEILENLLPLIRPDAIVTEFWEETEDNKHDLLRSYGYILIRQMHSDTLWCLPQFIREDIDMIKPGQKLKVDGETVVVETMWGQGRHTVYKLTNGSTMLDLHLRDGVELLEARTPVSGWGTTKTQTPRIDIDTEETDTDDDED